MKGQIPQYAWVRIGNDGLPVGHFSQNPPVHDKQNWCRIDVTEVSEEELLEGAHHMRHHRTTYPHRSEPFCIHCAKRGPTAIERDEHIEEQTMMLYTGDME